jgi:methanogenic corrinoid protein MtbC1
MDIHDTTPTYNLKVVVQETGLRPDTLRAWERRYGLPQPDRSGGGHRLYSRRDIEILKWLAAREREGMSISRAVSLWRRIEAGGRDPLVAEESSSASAARTATAYLPVGLQGGAVTLVQLRQAWLAAVLDFQEMAAEQLLTQAFALYPPELVCSELLQAGVREAGEGWCRGDISVQQEHFVTEMATRRLEALLTATPPPTRPERILMACAPTEEHAFSPLLLTFLLRRRGLGVVYLGANVPQERLAATVTATKPHIVILAAQRLPTAAVLAEEALVLRREGVRVGFGGAVFNRFPTLRERVAGHFLGEALEPAVDKVDELLAAAPPLPPVPAPLSADYRAALAHFVEHLPRIQVRVWEAARATPALLAHLDAVNASLARNLRAALALGDLTLAEAEVMWKECLPDELRLTDRSARRYLDIYYEAARAELDARAAIVVERLAQLRDEVRA